MRRGNLFWGVVLLLLGGMMLLDASNIRLPGGMRATELFWPILLLIAGAWIIFGVFLRGTADVEQASIDLQGASQARVSLNHGAGRLVVGGGASGGELARGSFGGGLRQSVHKSGDRLEVDLRTAAEMWIPFGPGVRFDWDVQFNPNVPMKLSMHTGADDADVDLSGLQVTDLKVETGASNTKVTLPARGRIHADFDLGAASLTVIVPQGVAARIRVDTGVSDVKVDSRFPRLGNVYQSADYETAANAVDMDIDAGAAQITVRQAIIYKENGMRRIDPRVIIGALLIVGGVLMLLQTMGMLRDVSELFFGGVFLIAGAAFLYVFATGSWWSAIPGCILMGLGGTILADNFLPGTDIGGALFLGSIGLAFWLVFLSARAERWWAIIPAGVMTTLAVVTLLPESFGGFGTGGVFFLGLAATFLLVALLTGQRWAYYPAAALGVMGILATTPYLEFANYLWAVVLIVLGGFLIFRFFQTRQ